MNKHRIQSQRNMNHKQYWSLSKLTSIFHFWELQMKTVIDNLINIKLHLLRKKNENSLHCEQPIPTQFKTNLRISCVFEKQKLSDIKSDSTIVWKHSGIPLIPFRTSLNIITIESFMERKNQILTTINTQNFKKNSKNIFVNFYSSAIIKKLYISTFKWRNIQIHLGLSKLIWPILLFILKVSQCASLVFNANAQNICCWSSIYVFHPRKPLRHHNFQRTYWKFCIKAKRQKIFDGKSN